MTTLTAKVYLYAVSHSWDREWILRASECATMSEQGSACSQYLLIGERTLTAILPSEQELTTAAIAALRAQQTKITAEAESARTRLEEAIQSLLALPAPEAIS